MTTKVFRDSKTLVEEIATAVQTTNLSKRRDITILAILSLSVITAACSMLALFGWAIILDNQKILSNNQDQITLSTAERTLTLAECVMVHTETQDCYELALAVSDEKRRLIEDYHRKNKD